MTTNENNSIFGPVIYQYTRAQAIEDGVLVDVSEKAREAGIIYPTALTAAVWEQCVTVPEKTPWQDEIGRLWDVLTVLRFAIRRSSGGQEVAFTVGVQNDPRGSQPVNLKALCGPGDEGEPVITIMLPHED
jgi:hypothetical protein